MRAHHGLVTGMIGGVGVVAACGAFESSPSDGAADASAAREGGTGDAIVTDAQSADADHPDVPPCKLAEPFGQVTNMAGLNSTASEFNATFSRDGRRAYLGSSRGGAIELYVSERASTATDFPPPVVLAGTPALSTHGPAVSSDETELFFSAGSATKYDIWAGAVVDGGVGGASVVEGIHTLDGAVDEERPFIVGDAMYFSSNRSGTYRIYRAQRSGGSFGAPVPVEGLDSLGTTTSPVVSADERTIYVGAIDPPASLHSIYVATRAEPQRPFGTPTAVGELNRAASRQLPVWISADGCSIVFTSDAPLVGAKGELDLYRAAKPR
jgi:hypothetical protein